MKYTNFLLICQTSFLEKVLRACIIRTLLRFTDSNYFSVENKPTHWLFMCKWAKVRPLWYWYFFFWSSEARKHLVHKLPLICTEIVQDSLTIIKVLFSKCSRNYTLWRQKTSFTTDSHALWRSNILLICHYHIEDILPVPSFALESFWNGLDIWNWKWI